MDSPHLESIRTFVREQLLGNERHFDSLPEPVLPALVELRNKGLSNWWIPAQYGGLGVSLEESVDFVTELAYGDAGIAFSSFISMIVTVPLLLFGTDGQRERFLRPLAAGGGFCATLGSEREAGSELLRTATTARRAGDSYVLRGEKFFSTNTDFAELLMVIAATPDEPMAFRAMLVPRATPGIRIRKRWPVIGVRASSTYEVALEDCVVAADSLLSPNGIRVLEVGLNPSRTLIAACAIGIGRRIRDLALEYAHKKTLKGGLLAQNPVFAAKLGQMELELDVMHVACKAAARQFDQLMALSNRKEIWQKAGALKKVIEAKLLCGQLGWHIASVGSELFGGLGYTQDHLIEKLVRDMRYVSILEGGEDALRELIYFNDVLPQYARRTAQG